MTKMVIIYTDYRYNINIGVYNRYLLDYITRAETYFEIL